MKLPTILIVDDEADLREAIAFDFRRRNFQVLTAGSGNEAFKLVEQNRIDVVLSDVCMRDGDGVQLLDRIMSIKSKRPAVMLITGFSDITLDEAYRKGADAVFPKPFDRKLLMDAVDRAVQPELQRFVRRSSRVDVDIPVELSVPGQGETLRGKILNMSRDGIFAEVENFFPAVSDQVEFRFQAAPAGASIELFGRGVVRWVRTERSTSQPPGCGIEFTDLPPECAKQVVGLINYTKTHAHLPMK